MNAGSRVFFSLLVVFLAGLGWFVHNNIEGLEHRYRESAEELLVDSAQLVAALIATDMREGHMDTDRLRLAIPSLQRQRFDARIFEAVKHDVNLRLYLTDALGRVVYHSDPQYEGKDFSQWRDVRLTLQGQYGARTTHEMPTDPESAVMYVAAPILLNGYIVGVVSIGKPTTSYRPFVESARENLLIGGGSVGLTVVLLACAIGVWTVRPFGLVTEYLRLFRNREKSELPRLGRSALGIWGAAYDEMRDALAGRNYVEEYVQALTHEIKSPLSAIRGAAELLDENLPHEQQNRFLKNIREETARIQTLVERLLELADLEKRRTLTALKRIDVVPIISETVESLTAAITARHLRCTFVLTDQYFVNGDRFLLQRALDNLFRNAVAFSPEGGAIDITLTTMKHHYEVRIRDAGPGIPSFAEKRVFDRFYSLPAPGTARKSTGLGLSFVREIADLHHGSVELKNHPDGGALAVLRLPKAK